MKRLNTITITKKQTKNRTKPETHKGLNSTPLKYEFTKHKTDRKTHQWR